MKRFENRRTPVAMAVASALAGGLGVANAQEAAPANELEEVVVTATRRETSVIDVPYNISAVSGAALEAENIIDNVDLMRRVPSVASVDRGYRNSGVINGIVIRGLNVDGAALGDYALSTVPSVSTYVNDTPIYANFILKDIERVEVLRGPQGTLYGSGSLGGTVRYIMRKPELGESGGSVNVTLSQVDGSKSVGKAADFVANFGISETAALRVSAGFIDYPGITDYPNVYTLDETGAPAAPSGVLDPAAKYHRVTDADSVKIQYGRAALLWKPSDSFDLQFSVQAQSDDIGGRRQETVGQDGFGNTYKPYENGSVILEPSSRDVKMVALEMDVDLGFATLTSSTSYYDHDGKSDSENTGFYAQAGFLYYYAYYPRPAAKATRTYSEKAAVQELRLVSNGEHKLDYTVGAYYQDQEQVSSQESYLLGYKRWWDAAFPASTGVVVNDNDFDYRRDQTFKEAALFGELTWNVTDRVHLTAGLRYFDNSFENDTHIAVGLYAPVVPLEAHFDQDDDGLLYKFNAAFNVGEQQTLYATVSQGYRRGGTNAVPTTGTFGESPAFQTYKSDSVTNYEVGFKGAAGTFNYSLAAYRVDWDDIQVNSATPFWGYFVAINGDTAVSQGLEAEVHGKIGDHFGYSLGYAYTDAKLTAPVCAPNLVLATCLATPTLQLALDGQRLPGAAENTANLSLDHTTLLASGNRWINRISGYYQSSTENAVNRSLRFNTELEGFQIWGLTSTLAAEKWDLSFFAKNIFNERGVTGLFTEAYMGTAPEVGYYGNGSKQFLSLPRTFGVSVNFRF
jgi:iron complex outermembrane recepter protein